MKYSFYERLVCSSRMFNYVSFGFINNIQFWEKRYLKNYIAEFSQYYCKIGHNETNLRMFYDKLYYPINFIINEKCITWLQKADVIDTLGIRISFSRKWVNDQCLDLQNQRK